MRSVLLWLLFGALLCAVEPVGFSRHGAQVALTLQPEGDQARLIAVFTPEAHHHVYGFSLPEGGAGVATQVTLAPEAGAQALGEPTADKPVHLLNGLPVFPPGPVTVTLRISRPTVALVPVLVSYLACTDTQCRIPVQNRRVDVPWTGPLAVAVPPTVITPPAVPPSVAVASPAPTAPANDASSGHGQVHRPGTRAEVEALLAAAGTTPVLLDFTGPSCVNCQHMEKSVFRVPAVVAALERLTVIQVNTDPPHDDLADWQQERFHSQNRPLYVRLEGGRETRWSAVFPVTNQGRLAEFVAFLGGGAGRDDGTGDGLGQFVLLALLGGLVTLLMPCTYPMIPFTVTFFSKQAAAGRRLLPLALAYGAGIMACFVGLGVLITGVFGANLASLAGHPLTNLVIGLLFVVLGLGLLGAFFLRLPAGLQDLAGGGRGGYFGALVMGLTFAITAFTCTAPFAGSVLAAGVATGAWGAAVGGMAIYSGAIAVPFVLLALSPGLLRKLPRAGAWMNEFKIVGGLVELAAAAKFLVICDHAWGWGIFVRATVLAFWAATALILAGYVAGRWRMDGDDPVAALSPGRLLGALVFLTLACWFAAGLAGSNLGLVEAFFPGDAAP